MDDAQICQILFSAGDEPCLLVGNETVLEVSTPLLEQFGCTKQEILGRPIHSLFPPKQNDGGSSTDQWRSLTLQDPASVGGLEFPFVFQAPNAEIFAAQVMVRFFKMTEAPLQLIQMKFSDGPEPFGPILNPGNKVRLEESNLESLGLLAGGVAHDFNNFLLAILGNADLLDRDLAAGKSGDELLNEIRKAAGRAADLCSQLLAYSGNGQPQFQPIDLTSTVQEMVPMLKVAISRKIVLHLEMTANLPLVEMDLVQIHQLVMNLVVNASEAVGNNAGTITLATGMTNCDPNTTDCFLPGTDPRESRVFLEVRDDGDGISAEVLNRIFDPYFSTKVRGRGLGLASVLGTIRSHQGNLCAYSTEGHGSTMRICFPVPSQLVSPPGITSSSLEEGVQRKNILVVDDEEYVRVLCSRMLHRLGYSTLVANDGAQALELYQENRHALDAVMLDLVMPGMDGIEVFERLQALDPGVKVIMTSGYHQQEIATRLAGKGIVGFIQKPYVLSDLAGVLGNLSHPEK